MKKKPNILWFETDEQRPDSLGCYGSPWARTPHADRLAKRGVVMQNAVCQSPVCLPSRSSQLSARYPHEFGCLNNMIGDHIHAFPEGFTTFTEVLKSSGYETLNFGRYHTLSPSAFEINASTPDALPEYASPFKLHERLDPKRFRVIHRPGKNHYPLIIAGTYPASVTPDSLSADRAISFLKSRAGNEQPWCLRVSFNQPHTPTLCPPPFDSLYNPEKLPVRYFDDMALKGRAAYDRAYAELHRMQDLTPDQMRQVWKDYFGLCAYVDHQLGRVMEAVDTLGLREETIIFYSSDHGKLLGEWGAGEKGSFDREVWRVPFIWSYPGHLPEGEVRQDPCELVDTGRTLLSLAGLSQSIPDNFRGRNIFEKEGSGSVFGVIRPPIQDLPDFNPSLLRAAVGTAEFRLDVNWALDGSRPAPELFDGNLFDFKDDPEERWNRFGDPRLENIKIGLLDQLEDFFRKNPSSPLLRKENAGRLF